MKKLTYIFIALLALSACDSSRVFQDYRDFDNTMWHQDTVVKFSFEIQDASLKYNLKTHVRYALQYPFHNMYYKYRLLGPGDEILMDEQMQIFLFDKKTGEPQGSGMGDQFDLTQPVASGFSFPDVGTYKVELIQNMRLDSLPFISSVGWRVEKAVAK
jgi:gliding motility-associated lipoprotein GldH